MTRVELLLAWPLAGLLAALLPVVWLGRPWNAIGLPRAILVTLALLAGPGLWLLCLVALVRSLWNDSAWRDN